MPDSFDSEMDLWFPCTCGFQISHTLVALFRSVWLLAFKFYELFMLL